jgi:GNAT superfamily N-acetyltransferase
MRETQEDMERLQALLDSSLERAGAFLRRSFQMPQHALTAQELVHCWQNVQTVALATVTTSGEPRIAPIDSLLYRGEIYIPTDATAARTRHVINRPIESLPLEMRPLTPQDSEWVRQEIIHYWGDTIVVAHGKVYQPQTLPGFVAITSTKPGIGIGTRLLKAVMQVAREAGCKRLWLMTTNDNLDALRFLQKRGFTLVAIHRGAVDAARQLKPLIPLIGNDLIPLHDEIELEMLVEQ